ncbi:putative SOS response-associated peptidase YedK [Acidovorax sp. 69]|uniref:SOS response-associated peptidase n=1 Tax=Acidovorax sp. 69 TaxID=2035202 RepID=UPI000C2369E6|nr:SOS response-associated peptidase [Acidovorax sp. 69]PJI95477.1 putative SOS response-associated peptidase YedK [Acidovorax sp. 69]
MSTHYETLSAADTYREAFAVAPPEALGERHLWPRKPGFFIVHAATAAAIAQPPAAPAVDADASAAADVEATEPNTDRVLVPAQWGLVPHWVKSASDAKLRATKLVNAKSDTASTGTAFRDAWLRGQRCIVPMTAFYEDDLRNGSKAVPTRVARVDGKPMGVAGLWARWQGADGEVIISYCLLTVNANNHALLHRYGQPGSEKSMPAILNEGAYDAWLTARPEKAKEFMRQYAAQWLTANPVEKKADKVPKGLLG